jgi:choline dehydrogenase-like flavoprotein
MRRPVSTLHGVEGQHRAATGGVVGAATAGCLLALRLTDGGRHRVLLLEVGGSEWGFRLQVSIGYGKSHSDPHNSGGLLHAVQLSLHA